MKNPGESPEMAPSSLVAGTLFLLFMVFHTGTAQFHVIGPEAPLMAFVGEEAVLPCHLSPSMDVQNMDVRWYRKKPSGLVHHYKNFQDHMEQQRSEYRGRTEFLRDNITKGYVALKIHSIQPSDGGEYSCSFESSTYINAAQFQVLVTGSGTDPHIHIDHGQSKGLILTCASTGWYPEPEVQWRDLQGQRFSPASETKTPEKNGLFLVETSIMLDESSQRNVTCYIRNPVLRVEKKVHISVTDALFPRVSSWPVVVPVFVVLLVTIGSICVLLVRARKSKGSLKEQHGILKEQYGILEEKYGKFIVEHDREKFVGKKGLNKVQRFAEDIKLDRATAHPNLSVSDDGKRVTTVPEKQDLPDNPERFDILVAVLGQNIFCDGRHYWEVRVAGKNKWTIGLCLDSVKRKGQGISVRPENGFWVLSLRKGVYQALSTPRYTLNVPEALLTVGIFLDYDEGLISFYNVTEFTILYTFKSKFTKPMKPYLYPGPLSRGNRNGLIIPMLSVTNSDDAP